MYTKIVVPLDGSRVAEQVLPYARLLAARLKLAVELITAIDVATIATSSSHASKNVERLVLDVREASETYLKQIGKTFADSAVNCTVNIGKPETIIIEKAIEEKGTLITMATHGRSGFSRWLLGSVAEKVLRGSTNPLLLVRTTENKNADEKLTLQSIVVPLDTSELAESALDHAKELAKTLDTAIVLAHAYAAPLDPDRVKGEYDSHYRNLAEQLQDECRKYIHGKINELEGQGFTKLSSVFLNGSPAEGIIELARRTPDSLIVMSTHGYSGVHRWVLGSVTEKVVRHSDNPVLIVRGR